MLVNILTELEKLLYFSTTVGVFVWNKVKRHGQYDKYLNSMLKFCPTLC